MRWLVPIIFLWPNIDAGSDTFSKKLRILKENQKIRFEIKEEKDKLQAINLKKV